jgi:hypothetical protein
MKRLRKGGELNAQGTLLCSPAFEAGAVARRLALPSDVQDIHGAPSVLAR